MEWYCKSTNKFMSKYFTVGKIYKETLNIVYNVVAIKGDRGHFHSIPTEFDYKKENTIFIKASIIKTPLGKIIHGIT